MIKFSDNAIYTKIKSIHSNRLKTSDYNSLLEKSSVSEVALYLKENTSYKLILENEDCNNIHRTQLESILTRDLFNKYSKIYKYNKLDKHSFFYNIIIRAEIDQILKSIMHFNTLSMDKFIINLPEYLINHASFNLINIAKVKNFDDYIKVFKHSIYLPLILKCSPDSNGIIDYTHAEIIFQNFLYTYTEKIIEKQFIGKTGKILINLLSLEIELINLSRIHRLKTIFKKPDDFIFSQLIITDNFSIKKIQKILHCNSAFDYIDKYKKNIPEHISKDTDNLEVYVDFIKYIKNIKNMQFSNKPATIFYSFFILSEIQVKNIIHIIEGIRYKADKNYIKNIIINN
ncbi:MAG: V-type ATPase subunit [Oscillospiraceae bacterium]|nr:V-type ATPase subunit [Oscillospiraceae bacterium]